MNKILLLLVLLPLLSACSGETPTRSLA
ncbi:MAG: lipoprotein [Granulosicoccus sp.]|nr:lipoprotein [Granulosicoccus sp.]